MQRLFHKSCALTIMPKFHFGCASNEVSETLFGENSVVVSMGMVLVGILSIPLAYWNLEENVHVQG